MKKQEAVLAVKFKSTLSNEALMKMCADNLGDFSTVPGLIKKYYLLEETTGAISGFYEFTSKSHREAFWNSPTAQGIPAKYGVIPESLRIERYEVAIIVEGLMPV